MLRCSSSAASWNRPGRPRWATRSPGDPAADALLSDPNAFLLGVLFTQGIPAERAWSGPWLLLQRLGTLDVDFLAVNEARVRTAVQAHPMLHRFKDTLPRWIAEAARKVRDDYGGDAGGIWSSGSTVPQVTERLMGFAGIGPKKAAMATEILTRHFAVELTGREYGRIAYDVQVRRVFLRSGLVDVDARPEVERAAARISPEAPGLLDLPSWLIGRQTCRPRSPLCEECRLGGVCLRRVWLTPVGVGARRTGISDAGYSAERKTSPESSFG